MKRRTIVQVLAAMMVCAFSGCGDREEGGGSLYGRSISKIDFRYQGERTVEEQRLRAFLISKPGDEFTAEAIDSDVKALYESGLVEEVRFLSVPDGDAVRLIAEVSTRRPSGPPFCIGNAAFSDKILAEASGLAMEREVTVEELENARQRLKTFYVSHGYPDADVVCRAFQGGDPSVEDYVFAVDEGPEVPEFSSEEKETEVPE